MKVQDLRIGNIVFVNEEVKRELEEEEYLHCHFVVTKIEENAVTIYSPKENIQHTEYDIKNLNLIEIIPIPLTDEWFIRFGFEKQKNTWWFNDLISYQCGYIGFSIYRFTKVDYVHEVQNYFHAVLVEELTS